MDKPEKKYRIGISGSYGGLNLGDESILTVILAQLRQSVHAEITVFTRNPADTLKRHNVDRAIPVRDFVRDEILPEIKQLDLFILGGGGIIFNGEAKIFLRELEVAHEFGVPVMVYAIGAGPLKDPSVQKFVKKALNKTDIITVREKRAKHVLEEAGVNREIIITADPAFLLEPEPLPPGTMEREGLRGKRKLVGISVREPGPAAPDLNVERYHSLIANAADFIIDRYEADVVFVPMEYQLTDVRHSHAIISLMLRPRRTFVLKGEYTPGQLLTLMGHFEFAMGMRLHFLIFAALQEVPFVALPYASKVTGLLERLGMEMPPLDLVNEGRLIAYIDKFWDLRKSFMINLREKTLALKKDAGKNNVLAMQLLKKVNHKIET